MRRSECTIVDPTDDPMDSIDNIKNKNFQIYSVENGIASVFIYVANRTVQDILIDDGFARTADENFMSKVDHDLRVRAQTKDDFHNELHIIEEEMRKMMPFEEACEIPEPEISKRHKCITLKG